ncbi:MAG: hypothetical protein LQ337_007928, partial [Flavoplaca oasis]
MMNFLTLSVSLASLSTVPSLVGALPTGIQNTTISSPAGSSPIEARVEEFLYQGFNFPADDGLKANITAAFADTLTLIRTVIDTSAWDAPFFDLYFPPETREGVATTYRNMLKGYNTELAFDNFPRPDFQDPEHRDVCVSRAGWAAFAMNEQRPKPAIHFCPGTWGFPKLNDIVDQVCSLPRMALNHLDVFHPGRRVRDVRYGPLEVQNLRKENPDEALNNADTYMWFAL